MTQKFERSVKITPAFDQRSQGHGIGGCDLIMSLKGKTGIVYFSLATNWQLPHVTKGMLQETLNWQGSLTSVELETHFLPSPIERGYHSPVPVTLGQKYTRLTCHHFPGVTPCYCDSGCIIAEEVYKILLTEGSEGVWKYLEEYYKKVFSAVEGDL
jgi:hypothetical protein